MADIPDAQPAFFFTIGRCKMERKSRMNFVFDMDDTMYDLMEPFKKAHEKLFADRAAVDCERLFMLSRMNSDIILEWEKNGKIRKEDTFYQRMRMTYQDVGLDLSREDGDCFEAEYRYYQTEIRIFGFMKEILDYCKKKQIPMAVLTNGRSKGQRKKADTLKLEQWFEHDRIFVSEEIGFQKPDVRAFKTIEAYLHFHPEDTWYVGDTYESDIVGASQAGWHTIWFHHRNRPAAGQMNRAEEEVCSGEELLSIIQKKSMVMPPFN